MKPLVSFSPQWPFLAFFFGVVFASLPIVWAIIFLFPLVFSILLYEKIFRKNIHMAKAVLGFMAAIIACYFMPVKQLDGKVGPMRYENISVHELSRKLYEDWSVMCNAYEEDYQKQMVSLVIDQKISRLEVIKRFAESAGSDFRIGTCGTNASILFGGFPCFTTLIPKK